MRVAVIGPGAMGCLYAARLAHSGVRTTLVDHSSERANRLEALGITVESSGEQFRVHLPVVTDVSRDHDLVIVFVKSYATEHLKLNNSMPILTLQNGLSNVATLCSMVGSSMVLAGVTSEAATLVEDGHVRHTATGVTRFGSWTSCPDQVAVEALEQAGFSVETTEAPGQTIWEKAILNAGINPLTALLDIPNGRLLDIPEVRQLMRDLVVESVKVATTEGYRFPYSLVEKTEELCTQTAENVSSMLQDVRRRKQTEIDAISGEIMRRGELASLPTPRTRMVWQLVKGLEQR